MNQNVDLISLNDEISKAKEELNYLLNILKRNEELISNSNVFSELEDEINSLKKELNSIKEINNKTTNFLLLEIESCLDKQHILQTNSGDDENIFNANQFKRILNDKNQKIANDNLKIKELNDIINSKNEKIKHLEEELLKISRELEDKVSIIDSLNDNLENPFEKEFNEE